MAQPLGGARGSGRSRPHFGVGLPVPGFRNPPASPTPLRQPRRDLTTDGGAKAEASDRRPADYNVAVDITIREARPAEFDVLWRIDQQCFPPGVAYSRAELAAYMRLRGAFTLVAESPAAGTVQTAIVGFVVARAAGKKAGHIVTIDVLPEARRHAVGSRLLRAAEQRLQAAGCHNVFLETAVDNLAAIRFYKKFDYYLVRTLPRYYSNGVDALHLVKELPPPAASG